MKFIKFFIITVLLYSCSQNNENGNTPQKDVADSINTVTQNEQNNNFDNIIVDGIELANLNSPENLKIEYSPASSIDIYSFFPNKKVVLTTENSKFDNLNTGTWEMSGDTVKMHFFKGIYQRGIGEGTLLENNSPNEEQKELFEVYVNDILDIDFQTFFLMSEFKQGLVKKYYKILDKQVKYKPELYDAELPGDYPFVSSRKISEKDLDGYATFELRIMRNEVFARYGYIFKSEDLNLHFSKKKWYTPKHSNVDIFVSDIEAANLELITEIEKYR